MASYRAAAADRSAPASSTITSSRTTVRRPSGPTSFLERLTQGDVLP